MSASTVKSRPSDAESRKASSLVDPQDDQEEEGEDNPEEDETGEKDDADVDEENAEEEKEEEKEEPYCPPPPCFIYVLNREGSPVPVNNRCRKRILVNYICCNLMGGAAAQEIDFCDLEGTLVGISNARTNDDVSYLFQEPNTYIPCCITRNDKSWIVDIEPMITDWQIQYPELEEALKMQTKKADTEKEIEAERRIQESELSTTPVKEKSVEEKPSARSKQATKK